MSRTDEKRPNKACSHGRRHCDCSTYWWNAKRRAIEAVELTEANKAIIDRAVERDVGCGVCGEVNDPACRLGC